MTLALLCHFAAQHVSDVNTSIFRSLRHEYGPMDNTMTLLRHMNNEKLTFAI